MSALHNLIGDKDEEIAALLARVKELTLLAESLRSELEYAAAIIDDEFCGEIHHPFCKATRAALQEPTAPSEDRSVSNGQ